MELLKKCFLVLFLMLPVVLYAGGAVNINTASKETLMTIKGVGEHRAEAIIQYRKKNGPFTNIDQLADIRGISQSLIDANRDTLVVKDNK